MGSRFGLAFVALAYCLFLNSCQRKSPERSSAVEPLAEGGIPLTIAIPLTPEQATALVGISEMSRIDEISRTDEMSRVDEGIRGVALDISVDGQMAAEGIRGRIVGGVHGGIRGAEASGVREGVRGALDRAAKAAPTRRGRLADPSRQAQDAPALAFEATFYLPKHLANAGSMNLGTRMRDSQNPQVVYLEVKTTVEVKPMADGSLDVNIQEKDLQLNEVEMIDVDGDGVATLTEVVVAGVDAALDSTTKPDEGAVKIAYEQMAKKLEDKMKEVGYEVKVDVSQIDLTPPDTGLVGNLLIEGFATTSVSCEPGKAMTNWSQNPLLQGETFGFTLCCNEVFCTYRCSLDEGANFACDPSYTLSKAAMNLADGTHTFSVKASDRMGNTDTTPVNVSFKVGNPDIWPPEAISIVIENGAEYINRTLVDVTVSAKDDNDMEMLLAQDTGLFGLTTLKWIPYATATKFSMPSGDGNKTVYIQFRDKAGNRSKIISDDITLDTKPPDTTATCPPGLTNVKLVSITFASPEAGVGFLCQLDTGTSAACTSPVAAENLADGAHAFEVKAKDKAGNVDDTPAACKWTVDTVPPDTSISAKPASPTNSASASFTFASPEQGVSFECDLDAKGYGACTSPKSYTTLAAGAHTFNVRAVDAAGNADASPAAHTWTIDLTPPNASITSQPSNPSGGNPLFAFSSNEAGSTFTCSLDAAAYTACTSPKSYSGLADGSHTFQVKATDPAGNVSVAASHTWTVDATPPAAPVAGNITVNQNAPGTADTIQGSAGAVEASSSVRIYSDGLLTSLVSQVTSNADGSFGAVGIGDNLYGTIYITATDAAGNQSASTSKTNDIVAPSTGAVTPANSATATHVDGSFDLSATASDAVGVTTCQYCKSTDGTCDTEWIAATFSAGSCSVTGLTCTDGQSLTLNTRATDAAGNTGTSAAASRTCDAATPSVGTVTPANTATATHVGGAYTLSTTFTDGGSGVTSCEYTTNGTAWSPAAWSLGTCSQLGIICSGGENLTLNMRATDAVGLLGTATAVTRTCDTGVPLCSISSITEGTQPAYQFATGTTLYYSTSVSGDFTVNASLSDAASGPQKVNFPATVSTGGDDSTSPYSFLYSWTTSSTFSGAANAICYDNVSNLQSASFTVTRDVTAPTGASLSLTNGYYTTASVSLTFVNGSDAASGIGQRIIQRQSATLSNGSCGSFGSFSNLVVDPASSPYNDTGVTSGNCYMYQFRVIDNVNNWVDFAPPDTAKVDTSAPAAGTVTPANTATASHVDSPFDLSATFSDSESGISGCEYCKSTDGTCDTEWAAATFSAGTCTQTGVTCTDGQSLTLNMRATNGAGTVGTASAVTRTCDATNPTQPGASLTTTPGNREMGLAWTASTDTGSGLNSYELSYCSPTACTPPSTPMITGIAGTSTTVTSLTNCVIHTFAVRAKDNVGNVSAWVNDNAAPALPAPTGLTVVSGAASAELSWSSVVNATEYQACYSASAGACAGTVVSTGTKTGDKIAGLSTNAAYFSVRGKDGSCLGTAASDVNTPVFGAVQLYQKNGGAASDNFGESVSVAGDVNGDGKDDFIVGAYLADSDSVACPTAATDRGIARVYSGADGSILYRFCGDVAGDEFGNSVSGGGDVNGDGKADVVVGAWHADSDAVSCPTTETDRGVVRVLSGADGSILYRLCGTAGPPMGDRIGASVSLGGDVNGDGFADVVVGGMDYGPDAVNSPDDRGSVYVYSGADGSILYQQQVGPAAGWFTSISVSAVGDANGDGKADFAGGTKQASSETVACPSALESRGIVRVFSGADGSILYRLCGTAAYDNFGYSVSTAGDVNGDGRADWIVGAPAGPGGVGSAGSATVYSGLDGSLLYQKNGGAEDYFGFSVSTAGDVNGDGKADFLVGAYGADPGGLTDAGNATVFSGLDGSLLYQKNGGAASDQFGNRVSTAGDVNGDGKSDFIVGAYLADPGGLTDAGSAYVFITSEEVGVKPSESANTLGLQGFNATQTPVAIVGKTLQFNGSGGTSPYTWTLLTNNSASATLSAAGLYTAGSTNAVYDTIRITDNTNRSWDTRVLSFSYTQTYSGGGPSTSYGPEPVAGAGDVNGDGKGDFIMGHSLASPGALSEAGSAYVISGFDGSVIYQKDGVAAGDRLGDNVSGVGDVNGDGKTDFIVGAYAADPSALSGAGSAFLYSGSSGGLLYQKNGAAVNEGLGKSVSGGADVNGDGTPDFMVGAPDPSLTTGGKAYVYSGADGSQLYLKNGVAAGDEFGISVSACGDMNSDGKAEFMVGAWNADPGGQTNGGSAFVYSGADGSLLYQKDGGTGSKVGSSVSCRWDVNGDGKADFLVGATYYNSGTGGAFLYSGADGTLIWSASGAAVNDFMGNSVSIIRDANGDGKADFVVGVYNALNGPYTNGGKAYVYSGSDFAVLWQNGGTAASEQFGKAVSTAGDINGDGRDDFLVANATGAFAYVSSPPPAEIKRPTGLGATVVSSSQIDLAWTDNSTSETGFRIEKRTPTGAWPLASSVGANVTTYSATGLTANTKHFFRVKAYNSTGDSLWSPEISAVTNP